MIKGMTGFGTAQIVRGQTKAVVEVKSVNHRYLDVVCYLPNGFSPYEEKTREMVREQMDRGRVTVSLKISHKTTQNVVLNRDNVKKYLREIDVIKKDFKLKGDVSLSDVLKLPGVFDILEEDVAFEDMWDSVKKGLQKALQSLMMMRRREGKCLAGDIGDQLKKMLQEIRSVRARKEAILADKKKVLSPEEFSSFQKSSDVNEEVSRLEHYIVEMKKLLQVDVPVGKKMDFVAQEMQRETNTIGSKVQDKIVSNAVIAMKSKIEKIREQSQNIE